MATVSSVLPRDFCFAHDGQHIRNYGPVSDPDFYCHDRHAHLQWRIQPKTQWHAHSLPNWVLKPKRRGPAWPGRFD